MSVTDETKKEYEKTFLRLINRFERELLEEFSPQNEKFILWFERLAATLRPASYRLYKASLVYWFSKHEAFLPMLEKINSLNVQFIPSNKLKLRTSALKNKYIAAETLQFVLKRLAESNSQYAEFLIRYLLVNIHYGLRPIEWATAEYSEKGVIRIKNAKSTNGRGNGKFREITYKENASEFLQARKLIECLQNLLKTNGWKTVYSSSRGILNKIQKDIPINKRICMYSSRHQFSANMKKNLVSEEELANLMGHSSVNTAKAYYGKKKDGYFMPELPAYQKPFNTPDILPDDPKK